jgi:putative SOS response-associated peptidase YedK
MCGRASLTASGDDLREVFGLPETPGVAPHYNVPPSQPLYVVRVTRDGVRRRLDPMRWGLIPSWANDPQDRSLRRGRCSAAVNRTSRLPQLETRRQPP